MNSLSKIVYPTIIGVCMALVGCSSPRYAPVTTRTPAKHNKPYTIPNNTGIYTNQAPPPYNPSVNPVPNTTISTQTMSNEPVPAGYYRVMPGDTLYKIARENNIAPKDLISWNAMENPNNIQPYQLVRISQNTSVAPVSVSTTPSVKPKVIDNNSTNTNTESVNYATNTYSTTNFGWPVKNKNILKKFDGKGIDLGGKSGDSISSVGDGTVIYANNMRGYGNLIIVSHGNDIVSAYAHLQQITVKEQQKVKKGQMIATMGNSQSDQVKLHFEIRKKSEPVDPIPYLK